MQIFGSSLQYVGFWRQLGNLLPIPSGRPVKIDRARPITLLAVPRRADGQKIAGNLDADAEDIFCCAGGGNLAGKAQGFCCGNAAVFFGDAGCVAARGASARIRVCKNRAQYGDRQEQETDFPERGHETLPVVGRNSSSDNFTAPILRRQAVEKWQRRGWHSRRNWRRIATTLQRFAADYSCIASDRFQLQGGVPRRSRSLRILFPLR